MTRAFPYLPCIYVMVAFDCDLFPSYTKLPFTTLAIAQGAQAVTR